MTPDEQRAQTLATEAAKGFKYNPKQKMTELQAKVWRAEMVRVQEGWGK